MHDLHQKQIWYFTEKGKQKVSVVFLFLFFFNIFYHVYMYLQRSVLVDPLAYILHLTIPGKLSLKPTFLETDSDVGVPV